ncbi:MAG: glycoside hydrolase family 31 protein [Lachnospiraceae bacterium]|nr:alpha-glucosidase [Robinsoniella sp.]MDY3766783.1 glycoside hydrolase family 31 protein [Lachnospiraceae bacterium]
MIRKYTYGNPIETDAVVEKKETQTGSLPYFSVEKTETVKFSYIMDPADVVYGLGENVRGINKRGWLYESRNADEPNHREDRHSLYASHNFLLIDGKDHFGVFIDYPGILTFDIGYTKLNELVITPREADLDVYIIEGESKLDIVKQFRQMIGRSYIAPKWAFGYQQSRWSYMDEEEIRDIAKQHRDRKIPLDAIYLDIDYMERYKDFTVNQETFPNFAEFVKEMKDQNIHLVPIIDAGVKVEAGYQTYEEGVANNYFCKNVKGEDFVAGVWPGDVHFPDFLNPDARKWFGHSYQFLLDQGIEGFWNDMNEPATFYTRERIDEMMEDASNREWDLDYFLDFKDKVSVIANNPEDYKKMFHNMNGERISHEKVHNLFGYNMTRAAGEAFEELCPDKRILMFSRSSYTGMHRYGGIWTGDNLSWWQHILLNIKMMPSLNMMGILYTGADMGGFGADATEDLVMRWMEFALVVPLMRNHSALDTRRQEVFRFENVDAFRKLVELRYGLIPYLYSEYMKAVLYNDMYFKPLSFVYTEDPFVSQVEDQLMVGESLMIAPVYTQNAAGRYVYLPEEMMMLRMRGLHDYECRKMEKGHHYVEADLDQVLLFLRPDHLLVLGEAAQSVAQLNTEEFKVIGFVREKAEYVLYDDDGYGKDYENCSNYTTITVDKTGTWKTEGGKELNLQIELYDTTGKRI